MSVTLIASCSNNSVIGSNGSIPWHISADLKFFKYQTKEKIVLMGRKTFESIGNKPLKNRTNVVVSSKPNYKPNGVFVISYVDTFLEYWSKQDDELFVIGGQSLYEIGFEYADRVLLTKVDMVVRGDSFFPFGNLIGTDWVKTASLGHTKQSESDYSYSFNEYRREL